MGPKYLRRSTTFPIDLAPTEVAVVSLLALWAAYPVLAKVASAALPCVPLRSIGHLILRVVSIPERNLVHIRHQRSCTAGLFGGPLRVKLRRRFAFLRRHGALQGS